MTPTQPEPQTPAADAIARDVAELLQELRLAVDEIYYFTDPDPVYDDHQVAIVRHARHFSIEPMIQAHGDAIGRFQVPIPDDPTPAQLRTACGRAARYAADLLPRLGDHLEAEERRNEAAEDAPDDAPDG